MSEAPWRTDRSNFAETQEWVREDDATAIGITEYALFPLADQELLDEQAYHAFAQGETH